MSNFSNDLILSIRNGENERVKSIIEHAYLYKSVDTTLATLLHYAAKSGNEYITKYLLDKGCYVDSQDIAGKTPLIMAMRRNHGEIIKILLEAGADINALNQKNKSALHYFAVDHGLSFTVCKLFLQELQKKCSTSKEVGKKMIKAGCHLYQAACLNNAEVIKYMLEKGFFCNSMHPRAKHTALHIAVLMENVESVRLLLQYGADVNAIDINGANPLFYIYLHSKEQTLAKVEIIQMLLNSGVSLTSCSSSGIFHVAHTLINGNHEVIRIIMQSNIDFSVVDTANERNILYYLAMNRNLGVAEELKRYISKFNVNIVDRKKMSPLFLAVAFNNVDMVKFLLEQGADANYAQITYSLTPLFYAYAKPKLGLENQNFKYQSEQCIELLLQHNADPQILITKKNGEIATLFDAASKANSLSRMKPIIAHLAMLKMLGTSISEFIYTKINSHQELKEYFDRCRRILRKKFVKSITVLKLLTGDQKSMLSCLNNQKSMLKLERMSYKLKAMSLYSYYFNTLRKCLSKRLHDKKFRNKASQIVCKILQDHFHRKHLVVDKVVSYLNENDLYQLYNF